MRPWLLSVVLLAACTDSGGKDSGDPPSETDADGDSFPAGEDCDDDDPEINPDAAESCDGFDNNCDGAVDEGVLGAWYADSDGDGFGDAAAPTEACQAPEGHVDDDTDCDDTAAAAAPGADELCDSLDNDCDGEVDEDDALDASTWFADDDGDLFGDAADTLAACEAPAGYVADDTDCDDTTDAANPSAVEVCDSIDNDCDTVADEDDAADAPTWFADTDGDLFGDALSSVSSCAQPAGHVADDTDCDDASAATYPGADEYCDGTDTDCDGTLDEDDAIDAATWYADADGDTYGDPLSTTAACTQPKGYVADSTDCSDASAATYPGADEYCDGTDTDCDGTLDEDDAIDAATWYADDDGDTYGDPAVDDVACTQPKGYVADSTDCDDTESQANPGETEVCDEIDNDCDGTSDEDDAADASTWYADDDGDTYGDPAVTDVACDQPAGYVADDTDCDDAEALSNPGETEMCDTLDNDCDTTVDEDDAADAPTWYADSDGDTYGDPLMTDVACYQPSGYVADDTDCDDAESQANPGETEMCDSLDNDCDATVDEDDAADALTWYADDDGDTYGDPAVDDVACYQPSGYVADDTDCDDSESLSNPGETEVCDTIDNDCDGMPDEDDAADALTWYADDDGDTYGDPAATDVACYQPSGYVADDTDCDDGEALSNPGEVEMCDSLDNDCDATVDEDDALDASTWYADDDGDTYGDPAMTDVACDRPVGYVADDTDCDDAESQANPGEAEVCDTIDNDCDEDVDDEDGDLDLSTADTWYMDSDGDDFGDASETTLTCEQPSGYVGDDTDCDDGDASINPDEDEVPQDGVDNDCDGEDAPYTVADLGVGDLIITEIIQNPRVVVDTSGEWFEVYNASGGAVDLKGLYVYDLGTEKFTVSGTLLVEDGEYVVFGNNGNASTNGGVTVDYAYSSFTLGNDDDEVYLASDSSKTTVFDGVGWDGGTLFPDPDGYAMNLDPDYTDAADNDDGDNWCNAISAYSSDNYGTPGAENDQCSAPYGDGYAASGKTASQAANFLVAQPITLADNITLTGFAMRTASGSATCMMGLYTDVGSVPDALLASSSGSSFTSGVTEVPLVGGPISLSAGTYWLAKVCSGSHSMTVSSTTTLSTRYRTYTYAAPPSSFGTSLALAANELRGMWLLGY